MMPYQRGAIGLAWMFISMALLSCGGENLPPEPEEPQLDLNEQTQKGWDLFRSHDYASSARIFGDLIQMFPDAPIPYIGLGWCDVERDSLEQAIVLFQHALRLDEQNDALAGVVVAASALGRDSLAVEAAYGIHETTYIFDGEPSFGYAQVVYLRALGEFHLLRWTDCYLSLRVLEPDLVLDLEAWDFREQLLAALEMLGGAP